MTRLERISRPVVGDELAQWIGRVIRAKLPGQFRQNRHLSARLVTPGEFQKLPALEREDVDALQKWLAGYRVEWPALDDVPLIGAHPRRPDLVVMDLVSHRLVEDRELVLAGLDEALWANISESRDPRLGLIVGQIVNTEPSNYQRVAHILNEAMYDAPATVTLGGLQMAIRTDQGVVEL